MRRFCKYQIFVATWLLSVVAISVITLPPYKSVPMNIPKKFCQSQSNENSVEKNEPQLSSFKSEEAFFLKKSGDESVNEKFFQYASALLRGTPYPGVLNYTYYMMAYLKLEPLKNVSSILSEFAPVLNDVLSFTYNTKLRDCSSAVSDEHISLFVAIISAPGNIIKRDTVRKTWLMNLTEQLNYPHKFDNPEKAKAVVIARVAFIIGIPTNAHEQNALLAENSKYRDILQVESIDMYYRLSKKVTGLLNWLHRSCREVHFVLKVDDDVYVNVRNLGYMLRQLDPNERRIYGTLSSPVVQRYGKWKMSFEDYPWQSYPTYLQGAAILIPGIAVHSLLAATQTIPYHPIDDIFLTGFCAERAKIRITTIESFLDQMVDNSRPDACHLLNALTWLMNSVEQMKYSHLAIEKFYEKSITCSSFDTKITVDPTDAVKLLFRGLL